MEFVGQPRPSGACNLLEVPVLSPLDIDYDEVEVGIGIRPKFSPLPRRRSSVTDEDSEPELPLCGSRRVSFADAKGLSLVQVKEFETWDVPKLQGYDSEGEGKVVQDYFLSPLTFTLPLSTQELFVKVRDQKVELETIKLLPGTTILRGVIRVLNISFSKAVYVRTTLDNWSSHFDLLAEYIPGSSDGLMDCFSFKLTLVPPFGEQGARVDFCLRYETPVGTFWANNNTKNYVVFCHQRMKGKEQKENVNKKSCLKTVSQNFSFVENIAATETSPEENISAVLSKNGEETNTTKAQEICDGQSGIPEADGEYLQTEIRQTSWKTRRKAARMARVKDYFAQRDRVASDTERDKSPPGAKEAAQEENPEGKRSAAQSFSEGRSESDLSHFVSECLETCSKSLLDDLRDKSLAHDNTYSSEPGKSESNSLADSAGTLTGGEAATDIPDKSLHSYGEPAPAECHNINKPASTDVGERQEQGTSCECANNTAAEPTDGVISAVIDEGLASQTSSFTFKTVVAPLYHQMFGRVGSESKSAGDWGNILCAPLNTRGLIETYPHTETDNTVPTDLGINNDSEVQGNVAETEELNQECSEEEETRLTLVADDVLNNAETQQDPGEMIESYQRCTDTSGVSQTVSGDTEAHPHAVNILSIDLLSAQIPSQNLHLQGGAQEDNLTRDLQNQTAAETDKCSQKKTNLDVTQTEAQEVMASLKTLFVLFQPSHSVSQHVNEETDQQTGSGGENDLMCVDESNKDDTGKTTTIFTTDASAEADNLLEHLHDLDPNQISHSGPKEAVNIHIYCCESVEGKYFSAPDTFLETHKETNNVEERNKLTNNSYEDETKHSTEGEFSDEHAGSVTKAIISNYHIHDDMFVELKEKDTLKDEPIIVSDIAEHCEMEAAVLEQEDFTLADTTEVKNWEMMVEEEEQNILTDQEKIGIKADIETVEKAQGGQLEDAGMRTALKNRCTTEKEEEKTQEELVKELTAARDHRVMVEEDEERVGEEDNWEIVAGKDSKDVVRELAATKAEKTDGEQEVTDETEVEKREQQDETEFEESKLTAEVQEVKIQRTNVQEEEEIEGEGNMETDLYNGDEAGAISGDQVKQRGKNVKEENPPCEEEILVTEEGDSKIVDAGSDSMTLEDSRDEVESFEERLDIMQNKMEDGLSASVNSVQDKRVINIEDTRKGGNAHIPTELSLYKEEDFLSSEDIKHDRSKAEMESSAVVGDLSILADEPDSDQTSHDSTSAESDSDDEVELYMRCLRAVHTDAQPTKDKAKDMGLGVGKRPSVSRSKLLSMPMPSISESLDEEQNLGYLQNSRKDMDVADIRPSAATAAPTPSSGQDSISRNVSWWKETFSCSNISKTLLYTTLLLVFLVVAYHYDFLACFGLYLISVVWLCCQGDRQPVKNNNRIG